MDTVQSLNDIEKKLFVRLIENGNDPEMAVKIFVIWKCLVSQALGFHELMFKINSRDDRFLASISAEAKSIVECISNVNSEILASPDHPMNFSIMSSLADDPSTAASMIEIFSRKDGVKNGVEELCDVMRDELMEILKDKGSCELNPNAKEWNPNNDSAPEEDRCLFLTFSNGYPFSEHEIVNFFTRQYGACIERVYVHHQEGKNEPPLFGKVVFTASSVAAIVMEGRQEAKFSVERKTLWCKRYDSRRSRRSRTSVLTSRD